MNVPASAELRARRTMAEAVAADFRREAAEFRAGAAAPDWLAWSHRLAAALGGLLAALGGPVRDSGSGLAEDGSAWLCPRDVLTVLWALADAATYRAARAAWYCPACEALLSGTCEEHAADLADEYAYKAVAAALGEAR
jgi:hypothetical protein